METKEMTSTAYYDSFSQDYHLIFNEWDDIIEKQAVVLDSLIKKYSKYQVATILDCSLWNRNTNARISTSQLQCNGN